MAEAEMIRKWALAARTGSGMSCLLFLIYFITNTYLPRGYCTQAIVKSRYKRKVLSKITQKLNPRLLCYIAITKTKLSVVKLAFKKLFAFCWRVCLKNIFEFFIKEKIDENSVLFDQKFVLLNGIPMWEKSDGKLVGMLFAFSWLRFKTKALQ